MWEADLENWEAVVDRWTRAVAELERDRLREDGRCREGMPGNVLGGLERGDWDVLVDAETIAGEMELWVRNIEGWQAGLIELGLLEDGSQKVGRSIGGGYIGSE